MAARVEDLRRRGLLSSTDADPSAWRPIATRPGALERFLADRDG